MFNFTKKKESTVESKPSLPEVLILADQFESFLNSLTLDTFSPEQLRQFAIKSKPIRVFQKKKIKQTKNVAEQTFQQINQRDMIFQEYSELHQDNVQQNEKTKTFSKKDEELSDKETHKMQESTFFTPEKELEKQVEKVYLREQLNQDSNQIKEIKENLHVKECIVQVQQELDYIDELLKKRFNHSFTDQVLKQKLLEQNLGEEKKMQFSKKNLQSSEKLPYSPKKNYQNNIFQFNKDKLFKSYESINVQNSMIYEQEKQDSNFNYINSLDQMKINLSFDSKNYNDQNINKTSPHTLLKTKFLPNTSATIRTSNNFNSQKKHSHFNVIRFNESINERKYEQEIGEAVQTTESMQIIRGKSDKNKQDSKYMDYNKNCNLKIQEKSVKEIFPYQAIQIMEEGQTQSIQKHPFNFKQLNVILSYFATNKLLANQSQIKIGRIKMNIKYHGKQQTIQVNDKMPQVSNRPHLTINSYPLIYEKDSTIYIWPLLIYKCLLYFQYRMNIKENQERLGKFLQLLTGLPYIITSIEHIEKSNNLNVLVGNNCICRLIDYESMNKIVTIEDFNQRQAYQLQQLIGIYPWVNKFNKILQFPSIKSSQISFSFSFNNELTTIQMQVGEQGQIFFEICNTSHEHKKLCRLICIQTEGVYRYQFGNWGEEIVMKKLMGKGKYVLIVDSESKEVKFSVYSVPKIQLSNIISNTEKAVSYLIDLYQLQEPQENTIGIYRIIGDDYKLAVEVIKNKTGEPLPQLKNPNAQTTIKIHRSLLSFQPLITNKKVSYIMKQHKHK